MNNGNLSSRYKFEKIQTRVFTFRMDNIAFFNMTIHCLTKHVSLYNKAFLRLKSEQQ